MYRTFHNYYLRHPNGYKARYRAFSGSGHLNYPSCCKRTYKVFDTSLRRLPRGTKDDGSNVRIAGLTGADVILDPRTLAVLLVCRNLWIWLWRRRLGLSYN